MTMSHMQHFLLTTFLLGLFFVGCSPKVEYATPSDETSVGGESLPPETMLSALVTSDQQKEFGPFPCWKTHEGPYRYQVFMMRYFLNDETQVRDINKSWIGALYRDVSFPNRYLLRFAVRQRLSENEKWQIVNTGNVLFDLNGNEIKTIKRVEMTRQTTAITISVCVDTGSCRYFQIKISDCGCHDDFRTFIKP